MAKSLSPAKATKEINKLASDPLCNLSKSPHAEDRLEERTVLTGDLLYLLKNGFIFELAEASTRKGFWKYKIEGVTPNSNRRTITAIIIPDFKTKHIKIVTCYWKDNN